MSDVRFPGRGDAADRTALAWQRSGLALAATGAVVARGVPTSGVGNRPVIVDAPRNRLYVSSMVEGKIRILDRDTLAPSNAALVKRAAEICGRHGRPVADWRQARRMLGLRPA